VAFVERSLALAEQIGDQSVVLLVLRNLGGVCEDAGFLPKAIASFERARLVAEASGDHGEAAKIADRLADLRRQN